MIGKTPKEKYIISRQIIQQTTLTAFLHRAYPLQMAAAASSTPIDVHDFLNKLKDKDFIGKIFEQLKTVLDQMNAIGRHAFREYDELLVKVGKFKKALLNYVLDSMIHLEVLKDNFTKKKYQQESDLTKARFINSTLNKIDRIVLKEYLAACLDLIALTDSLREKYGGTLFVIEYIVLNLVSSTLFGAAVGAIVGLILPYALPVEAGIGAAIGLIGGLIYVGYKLTTNWRQWKDDIENVRETLLQIRTGLEKICNQLETANNRFGKAKTEGDLQEEQLGLSADATRITYQDISDLENYVCTTHDAFGDLKAIILNSETKKTS
jgi:hypothetical protein